jgi:glutamate synthase (NADPH/NADH) small chain
VRGGLHAEHHDQPVTIKSIECAIVDKGWEKAGSTPQVPAKRTGKSVAVVGSGPAGMACAQQLARAGHSVTLFEKNDRIGGLLRYGIPDFKMEKHLINRRMMQMEAEGVQFRTASKSASPFRSASLQENFDAVVLSGGAEDPRKLDIPGANCPACALAMEFLTQQNKRNAGDDEMRAAPRGLADATGKHVIVIGGGDTGSDCVGTSNRQGAPRSPRSRSCPSRRKGRQGADLAELAAEAAHLVQPRRRLRARLGDPDQARCRRKRCPPASNASASSGWRQDAGSCRQRIHAQGRPDPAGAMGFLGPRKQGMLDQSGVELDARGNVKAEHRRLPHQRPKIFACGDMRRGQSLVVWAIREGRQAPARSTRR